MRQVVIRYEAFRERALHIVMIVNLYFGRSNSEVDIGLCYPHFLPYHERLIDCQI